MNSVSKSSAFSLSRLLQPAVLIKTAVLFYCLFSVLVSGLPFFGDHVTLVSDPANYFYNNQFGNLLLPAELDTGHPPFYAAMVALIWKVAGKNLFVTHCITLICMLFLLTQFYILTKKFLSESAQSIALILFTFQPVLLAQTAAMSSDILLAGLFLAAINGLQSRNNLKWILAVALGCLISLRGWVSLAAVTLIDLQMNGKTFFKRIKYYALAIWPVLLYMLYRRLQSGYWLVPQDGAWAAGRAWAGGLLLGGKLFEFTVHLLEFGMIIPACMLLSKFIKSPGQWWKDSMNRMLLITIVSLAIFTMPFHNPILIRYYLPVIVLMIILFAREISLWKSTISRNLILVLTILLFITTHFYAYPQMQNSLFEYSWGDGSLAHLAYFECRKNGKNYLNDNDIDPEEVYTGFPEYKSFEQTDLTDDRSHYQTLDTAKIDQYHFVIYSNIMNGIPKQTEDILKSQWKVLAEWKSYPVEYFIFENPDFSTEHRFPR